MFKYNSTQAGQLGNPTCTQLYKSVPFMDYTDTTARLSPPRLLHSTTVWVQPEFIWFLCCINFGSQRAFFICSPPLIQVAHATVALLKLFRLLFLKSWMTPLLSFSQKVWTFPVWQLPVLGWHGMPWLSVHQRIYSGANLEYKWPRRRQEKPKGAKVNRKGQRNKLKGKSRKFKYLGYLV